MADVPQEHPDAQAILTNANGNEPQLELPQFAAADGGGSGRKDVPTSHDQSGLDPATSLHSLAAVDYDRQFAAADGGGSDNDAASHDQSWQDPDTSHLKLPSARSACRDAGQSDLAAAFVVETSAVGGRDAAAARKQGSAPGSASSRPGKPKAVYSRLYDEAMASQRLRADFAKAMVAAERDALAAEAPHASPVSPGASLRRPASPGGLSRVAPP